MDIHIITLPLQILILVSIIIFSILAYKKPGLVILLIPVVLPFYLIKIYIKPAEIVTSLIKAYPTFWQTGGGNHFIPNFLNLFFVPGYQQMPTIRPDFNPSIDFTIPTNLLETMLLIFLIINWKLAWKGLRFFLPTSKNSLLPAIDLLITKLFFASIVLLLLASFFSTMLAINQRVALGAAKSWFFLPGLLFFALLPLLRLPEFRKKLLYSLALSGIVTALFGLPFLLSNLYTYDGRLSGIFLSPNHLAMALTPGILALLILLLVPKNPLPVASSKTVWTLTMIVLVGELIILYKTCSYGTWLGILAATFIMLISSKSKIPASPAGRQMSSGTKSSQPHSGFGFGYFKNKFSTRFLILSLLTIFILLGLFFSQRSNPKLQHILNGDYSSSFHSRLMIWQSAWTIFKDHWPSGVGADNFQQAYLDYASRFKEPYLEWSAPQPHNIFLAFMTELGILGLVSFVGITGLSLLYFLPVTRYATLPVTRLSLWAFSYLIYLLVHGLTDTPYFKNDLALLFWFAIAIIWALPASPPRAKRR